MQERAKSLNLPTHVTIDAGRTQIAPSECHSCLFSGAILMLEMLNNAYIAFGNLDVVSIKMLLCTFEMKRENVLYTSENFRRISDTQRVSYNLCFT